ncbi:uncharacterized protein LY79DRAFT_510834, partial [Colletotrichum navitas]
TIRPKCSFIALTCGLDSPRIFETLGVTDTKFLTTGFYGIAKTLSMVIFSVWLTGKVGRRNRLIGSPPTWYISGYIFRPVFAGQAAAGNTVMLCVYRSLRFGLLHHLVRYSSCTTGYDCHANSASKGLRETTEMELQLGHPHSVRGHHEYGSMAMELCCLTDYAIHDYVAGVRPTNFSGPSWL